MGWDLDPLAEEYAQDFRRRMDDGQETARLRDRSRLLGAIVRRRRKPVERRLNVEGAATLLGVSRQRVRLLCAQGRIIGAKKTRGDWNIPVGSDDLPVITIGRRGPKMGHRAGGESDDSLPF